MRIRRGFTLVELSIVLIIIGFLIGGILKGKAMIDNSKQKRVKSDLNGIVAAVYSYQDKYGYFPGDDPADISSSLGVSGCTGGDGNGFIYTTSERICAWRAIIASGLVSGDKTQTTENAVAKQSPYGGRYLFRYQNNLNGKSGNYISLQAIPLEVIRDLDKKYDDGVYNKGDLMSNYDYTATNLSQYNDRATMYWFIF